jgi:DNA-binding LytR/AlgR family response regulator
MLRGLTHQLYHANASRYKRTGCCDRQAKSFQRSHRSAIVALAAIREIHRGPSGPQVVSHKDTVIKVSRSFREALRKLMY